MTTKTIKIPSVEKGWEIKDRTYVLTNNRAPISWTIQTKHTARKPLLYFNEETGINREIRYATNQRSLFVDEQDGAVTLSHVMFLDGVLYVPKEEQNLQKLLSLYHPEKNQLWMEIDEVQEAEDEIDVLEMELEALNLVNDHELGNGAAVFTKSGNIAKHFTENAKIGMIGVNVPIPVPVAYHSFGGWKRSLFGDHSMHGPEGVRFYTKLKTATVTWVEDNAGPEFTIPVLS